MKVRAQIVCYQCMNTRHCRPIKAHHNIRAYNIIKLRESDSKRIQQSIITSPPNSTREFTTIVKQVRSQLQILTQMVLFSMGYMPYTSLMTAEAA